MTLVSIQADTFANIRKSCVSENSSLGQHLSPLLEVPLSSASVTKLQSPFTLTYPGAIDDSPKYLEFLTTRWPGTKGLTSSLIFTLNPFLERNTVGGSNVHLHSAPVRAFGAGIVDETTAVYCIEWQSHQDRSAVFADPLTRRQMRATYASRQRAVLQDLAKEETRLTWEDDLRMLFLKAGAIDIRSQLMMATLVDNNYLGLKERGEVKRDKPWKQKSLCAIL